MATATTSSSEFAVLVNKLQTSPNDPQLKQVIINYLPQMRELAKTSPLALYHLAQVYPPNSVQYQHMIKQSADLGCTNAMLAMVELLIKVNDLHQAAHYVHKIERAHDSYISQHAVELVAKNPLLAKIVHEGKESIPSGYYKAGFFAAKNKEVCMAQEPAPKSSAYSASGQ